MADLARLGAEEYNRQLFDRTWRMTKLIPPDVWPSWKKYKELADAAPRRLEIGPGIHPKLPIEGTHVIDLSDHALDVLGKSGAIVHKGLLHEQKFEDGTFDLVGIFEVLEHVQDDTGMLKEIHRILKPGGMLALDVPVHMRHFSAFDDLVGHVRRYETAELRSKIEAAGFDLVCFEGRYLMMGRFMMWVMALFIRIFPKFALGIVEKNGAKLRKDIWVEWKETDFESVSDKASDIAVICRKR
ncbi:MAG: methyltransferase domain-containing protein [Polyangiaceae bacterium]